VHGGQNHKQNLYTICFIQRTHKLINSMQDWFENQALEEFFSFATKEFMTTSPK
jgi:hypothetical protein